MFPQIEYKRGGPVVSFNGNGLEYLQSIYRDPAQEQHTRMRAAIAALPFESPKLIAAAIGSMSLDFEARLERAVRRSNGVRLLPTRPIELAQPEPQPFRRRV
jgi:hypothetical protein